MDLSEGEAWLTDGEGHSTRGPVPNTTGRENMGTPEGAFHGGSVERDSSGCAHLGKEDSKASFDQLQVNDEVQVIP